MKRYLPGLNRRSQKNLGEDQELYLVQVERARHRYHFQKPYFQISMVILEPRSFKGKILSGRIYCTPRALWKLRWFLKDFGYDTELMGKDELDEKALIGLRGIVKVSHIVMNGDDYLNFDGFAPTSEWQQLLARNSSEGLESR
jgi:hypothetical protein